MNRLQTLVDGHRRPGVYRWDAGALPGTAAASLARGGRPVAVLDGRFALDKAGFLDEVALALHFPAHFGRNWDAMVDCLRDVEHGTVLIWDRAGELALLDPDAYETALDILREAATDDLTTLLRGAPSGPPLL